MLIIKSSRLLEVNALSNLSVCLGIFAHSLVGILFWGLQNQVSLGNIFFRNERKNVGLGSDWNFRSRVAGTIFQGGSIGPVLCVTSFPTAPCAQSVCFDLFLWTRQPSTGRAERQQAAPCHTKDKHPPSQSTRVGGGGREAVDIHILLDKHRAWACVHSGASFHTQADD